MKLFQLSLLVLVISLEAIFSVAWASPKKGVGLWDLHAGERIAALNVAWYYTWKTQPIEGVPRAQFVPMLWGGTPNRLNTDLAYLHLGNHNPVLLAINEPDRTNQANMSVDEAARLWPEISTLAERVSTPATAGIPGPWFDRFYRIARARGLKIDFMAVHLYGPPDAEKFLKRIDAVYEKYRMPIWITEFAVADWEAKNKSGCNRYSEKEVLAFMKVVLPGLEVRPFVIRYAWFGAGDFSLSHEQIRTSRLFEKDGSLTPLGDFYARFSWSEEEKNKGQ